MLAHDAIVSAIDQARQGQADQKQVVNLADERNHVRNKVERNDRVNDRGREQRPLCSRDACIDH